MARRYLPFRPNGLLVGQAHRLRSDGDGMGAAVGLLFERSAQVLDGKEGQVLDGKEGEHQGSCGWRSSFDVIHRQCR